MTDTTHLVEKSSAHSVNERIGRETEERVTRLENATPGQIGRRLEELKQEWDVERAIELEAAIMILLGSVLGAVIDRKWLALPILSSAMLILHNTKGPYLLLPLLRSLGMRAPAEIARERYALKALRGDFRRIDNVSDETQALRAIEAASS